MSGGVVEKAWLPDGHGLPDEALEIMRISRAARGRDEPVHLRLTAPDGRAARGACGHGLGQWWTGVPSEVNCPACLQVVHS